MPSGQSPFSKYRDSLIKVSRVSSASNQHFVLLISFLRFCLLFVTGVLALRKPEEDFLAIWYDSLKSSGHYSWRVLRRTFCIV